MTFQSVHKNVEVATSAWTSKAQEVLTPECLELLIKLHRRFEIRREQLLSVRKRKYAHYDQGKLPEYPDRDSYVVKGDWKVAPIPQDLQTRRVEITGPVNDTKMVINMLSRNGAGHRADTAMLDFEDSMCPTWSNVVDGVHNVIGAASGNLQATKVGANGETLKTYKLNPEDSAGLMVRVRGLHLSESNVRIDGRAVSAGLFDFACCFFHTAKDLTKRGKTPKYYVPKVEHALEAEWWNDLFVDVQESCGFEKGTLRATFLIETLTAAFQIEEILYEIREHAAGLNVGRWDKIFSDIKVLKNHPSRVTPDRSEINMKKFWMDNYAKRLIKICHERGAFAIGGMSAFTPGSDSEVREAQTNKVLADKKNEFDIGHDGCWVSHPYFVGPALECFPKENQVNETLADFDRYPNLVMESDGKRTEAGLRTNVRVGIAYLQGWNNGLGCVAWDNMMEDLATLEISRAQIWQWLTHQAKLEDGRVVSQELVKEVFAQELSKIKGEVASNLAGEFERAARQAQELFLEPHLRPFLSEASAVEAQEVKNVVYRERATAAASAV